MQVSVYIYNPNSCLGFKQESSVVCGLVEDLILNKVLSLRVISRGLYWISF